MTDPEIVHHDDLKQENFFIRKIIFKVNRSILICNIPFLFLIFGDWKEDKQNS